MKLKNYFSKIMIDIRKIRSDFPIFSELRNNNPFIYFDNAATTQKPKIVVDSIYDFYTKYNSNIQRGLYFFADKAGSDFENSRKLISSFLNTAHAEEIIFTSGTTQSINMVAFGYLKHVASTGGEVLIGEMEHHANIVPWQVACAQLGLKLNTIKCCENGKLDLLDFKTKLSHNVKLVAVQHVSNITGHKNNIKKICDLCKENQTIVFVDGAQAISNQTTNVQDLDCDFYCFSGHKLFGPSGVGVLYGKKHLLDTMDPVNFGGNMINSVSFSKTTFGGLPQKLEAGTPNIAGVIGLGAAIKYINNIGIENIYNAEKILAKKLWDNLSSNKHVVLDATQCPDKPIFSFNVKNKHHYDIGSILDEMNVCVRTGKLCAQTAISKLNVNGLIRASLCFYNTKKEIDFFINSLNKAIKFL